MYCYLAHQAGIKVSVRVTGTQANAVYLEAAVKRIRLSYEGNQEHLHVTLSTTTRPKLRPTYTYRLWHSLTNATYQRHGTYGYLDQHFLGSVLSRSMFQRSA